MANELTPDTVDEFRRRFGVLHDAVIHSIHYDIFSYSRAIHPETVILTLGAFDGKTADECWVNLIFEFTDIKHLSIRESRNYYIGIVFNLFVSFVDGHVCISDWVSEGKTLDDFHDDGQPTQFTIISKRCFWSVAPYHARGEPIQ